MYANQLTAAINLDLTTSAGEQIAAKIKVNGCGKLTEEQTNLWQTYQRHSWKLGEQEEHHQIAS